MDVNTFNQGKYSFNEKKLPYNIIVHGLFFFEKITLRVFKCTVLWAWKGCQSAVEISKLSDSPLSGILCYMSLEDTDFSI